MTIPAITVTPECINEVMNTRADDNPEVGMPATMFVGSDRYPMIVREVKSSKRVIVSHMHDSDYESYQKDPKNFNGVEAIKKYELFGSYYDGQEYSLRKNGRWLPKGTDLWGTCSVRFGVADRYMDPCF